MRPKFGRKSFFGSSALMRELDRVAAPRDVRLLVGHRFAGGDVDLLLHDVHAGDLLGHGVLDLQARVHLHEVEVVMVVEQELDRAGVLVAHRLGRLDGEPHTCWRCSSLSCGEGAISTSF